MDQTVGAVCERLYFSCNCWCYSNYFTPNGLSPPRLRFSLVLVNTGGYPHSGCNYRIRNHLYLASFENRFVYSCLLLEILEQVVFILTFIVRQIHHYYILNAHIDFHRMLLSRSILCIFWLNLHQYVINVIIALRWWRKLCISLVFEERMYECIFIWNQPMYRCMKSRRLANNFEYIVFTYLW